MMANGQLIVVALGGNAISQPHEEGHVDQQFANSEAAARPLADMIERGHQLIITHGNGPQIGNFLLRNKVAAQVVYPLPMEVAVAHVQGGMGFMIAQTLSNELQRRGHERPVTAVVTTVEVDSNDPSFAHPEKPIGRVMNQREARRLIRQEGWNVAEVEPDRFRRVVPSPHPQRIMEIDHIQRAVESGELLVVCGGGGIPIVRSEEGSFRGVRAVIDKDHVSALLATELNADAMMILTNVERVCINFGKPDQRDLESMTVGEAEQWIAEGQFPAGSMGPKIEAAVRFLQSSTKPAARVLIGALHNASAVLDGSSGTAIVKA